MRVPNITNGRIAGVLMLAFLGGAWTAVFAGSPAEPAPVEILATATFDEATPVETVAVSAVSDVGVVADGESAEPATAVAADPTGKRVVVSIDKRWLWLVEGRDTLMSVPVAVGMNSGFEYAGRKYYFETPRGKRRVRAKAENPVWTVPEWHYYERAKRLGLEVVKLEMDSRIELEDGSELRIEGDQVGRVNQFGNFWPITPGNEIVFDGKVFIPPMETAQRKVPDALGPYKLDMGDGYLIHGTHIHNEDSVGEAVSHGCVRMRNEDLEQLYRIVNTGTTVHIY